MPRATRVDEPGLVLHITHRCHKKEFLLKFKLDRARYCYWLFQAKKRYGFCVLNYMITSNHIHLLVKRTKPKIIAKSMQLIAGRTAQEYNKRKDRKGAYWQDRYHVCVIQSDDYLHRCLTYIDLNMVRTGRVKHPLDWEYCGYYELMQDKERYNKLSIATLLDLLGYRSLEQLKKAREAQVQNALIENNLNREPIWTQNKNIGAKEEKYMTNYK